MIAEVSSVYALCTNTLGVIVCLVVAFTNTRRFKEKNKENLVLLMLLLCAFLSCIADQAAVFADGEQGNLQRICVYACNTWLFGAAIISGMLWIAFMEEHIYGKNTQLHLQILQVISICGMVLLCINLYIPMVFAINGNNVYERRNLFFVYSFIEICYLIDSIYMYITAKYKHGGLGVLKIWLYIVPIVVGMIVQLLVYGTSLIWPSSAVAVASLFIQLNLEDKYRDSASRLYRLDYLEVLNNNLNKSDRKQYAVIVLQVLGLANIGKVHGSAVENDAKRTVVGILKKVIKPTGIIIQCEEVSYAVVLNAQDETVANSYIDKLQAEFQELNRIKNSEYSVTVVYEQRQVDIEKESISDVIQELRDKL